MPLFKLKNTYFSSLFGAYYPVFRTLICLELRSCLRPCIRADLEEISLVLLSQIHNLDDSTADLMSLQHILSPSLSSRMAFVAVNTWMPVGVGISRGVDEEATAAV